MVQINNRHTQIHISRQVAESLIHGAVDRSDNNRSVSMLPTGARAYFFINIAEPNVLRVTMPGSGQSAPVAWLADEKTAIVRRLAGHFADVEKSAYLDNSVIEEELAA